MINNSTIKVKTTSFQRICSLYEFSFWSFSFFEGFFSHNYLDISILSSFNLKKFSENFCLNLGSLDFETTQFFIIYWPLLKQTLIEKHNIMTFTDSKIRTNKLNLRFIEFNWSITSKKIQILILSGNYILHKLLIKYFRSKT